VRLGVEAALVGGRLLPGDVTVEDGVVTGVGHSAAPGARGIAAPGFVDLQVNGYAGVDLMTADAAGWACAGEALLAAGVTAFQPTFVTAPEDALAAALRGLAAGDIGAGGPRIIGAHLEGPFLSPRRLGVHDPGARVDPDLGLLERLLAAGPVSQVTLAPELPGALELVDALVARGIVVSAGHTDATAEEAHRAFDRGVRTVTHLFNAMRPPAHRDPGIAYAALARDDVVVQLIADGVHLADDTVLVAWQAARGRVALVTDAAAPAGAGDGASVLGGREVVAAGGVVRAADGTLAGSASSMVDGVRHLHGLGVPLEDALSAASSVPARVAGRRDLGRLEPGAPADIVVLDDRLEVQRVYRAGSSSARSPNS
jgi:N-acetylglucosamine-6-phosphate deacetylase